MLEHADANGVSVVVPVFRSGPTLAPLVQRISDALADRPHEVLLVDDGSPPATWEAVREVADSHAEVIGLRLGRNFGQHSALLAGLRHARYPITVTLDDDLQNPPEEIPKLIAVLDEGAADVVYGYTPAFSQGPWRRVAGRISRRALSSALGAASAARLSSFRAFRTQLRDAFAGDVGPSVALDPLLAWGTDRFVSIDVEHSERIDGESNYTFRRLVRFAIDTMTGYSAVPLQLATLLGFVTALFGVGVLAWAVGRALFAESVPGFPFLASVIAIFSGAQLLTLGIIGEYLARMHFRVMNKPSFVIERTTSVKSKDDVE